MKDTFLHIQIPQDGKISDSKLQVTSYPKNKPPTTKWYQVTIRELKHGNKK